MTTCANCSSEAFFAYVLTASYNIPYCSKHVPKFLKNMSSSLVKISELSIPSTSKKKKDTPVVKEPEIELPVVEEPELPVIEEYVDEGELEVEEGN